MKHFSKRWKAFFAKSRELRIAFSAFAFTLLSLGVLIGWSLGVSARSGSLISLIDWLERYGILLELVSAFALLTVTAIYVVFTYRQSMSSEKQAETSIEGLELARKQLELLRDQIEVETKPKIFITFESISGESNYSLDSSDVGIFINNFSRYPVLIDYIYYKLPDEDKSLGGITELNHEAGSLKYKTVPPYGAQQVPKFFHLGSGDYWVMMFFYYGATGGIRYRYAARISGGTFSEVRAEKLTTNIGFKIMWGTDFDDALP